MYYITGMKLLFAMLVGGIIGFERQSNNRPAGLKTHILVTLGSTLIMILSLEGFESGDPARLAAQVVSGVGFLGAGTILVRGKSVYGLTTAASLWISACMGLAIGLGFFVEVLMTLGVVLFSLGPLNFLKMRILNETNTYSLNIYYSDKVHVKTLYNTIANLKIEVNQFEVKKEKQLIQLKLSCSNKQFELIKKEIIKEDHVIGFENI